MPLVTRFTNGISCSSRQPLTVGVYLQKQSSNTVNTGPFLDRSSSISHFHDISFSPLAPRQASTTSIVLHYAILLRTRCSTRPRIMYAASQLIAAALCGDLTSLAPAPRNAPCMQPHTYHPTLRLRECRRETLQDLVEIAKSWK